MLSNRPSSTKRVHRFGEWPDDSSGYAAGLAKRGKTTTVTLQTSHVPMLSQPERMADVIIAAARGVQ